MKTLAVGAQVGDEHALALEAPAGREHGVVLDGGGDDKGRSFWPGKAALLGGRLHKAEGAAASSASVAPEGEDDLIGPGAQGPGRAASGAFQKVEGGAPRPPVQALALAFTARLAGPGTWKGAMAPAASAHKGAVAA